MFAREITCNGKKTRCSLGSQEGVLSIFSSRFFLEVNPFITLRSSCYIYLWYTFGHENQGVVAVRSLLRGSKHVRSSSTTRRGRPVKAPFKIIRLAPLPMSENSVALLDTFGQYKFLAKFHVSCLRV